ncbi:MAG TPA: hypothetical protein VFJ50_07695, partial [Gemmatimonadales bacterium]|nr:hypothetical protein [Gemmatimonadales bacterium]
MARFLALAILVLMAACGGHRPAAEPAPATRAPAGRSPGAPGAKASAGDSGTSITLDHALILPPAPLLDTLVPPEELAAELRLAADSAADEA